MMYGFLGWHRFLILAKNFSSAQHRNKADDCHLFAMYCVSILCGSCYTDPTSRCINERLLDHKRNVRNETLQFDLVLHVTEWPDCGISWKASTFINKEKYESKRLLKEALCITDTEHYRSNLTQVFNQTTLRSPGCPGSSSLSLY